MNRRDLLKNAGIMLLAAPSIPSAALDKCGTAACNPSGTKKKLIVNVIGPYGFRVDRNGTTNTSITVMAAPVGPDFTAARHQPWLGTTTNECQFLYSEKQPPQYELQIPGYVPPTILPTPTGTTILSYPPGMGSPKKGGGPIFTVTFPVPNGIIGINPTCVCVQNVKSKVCAAAWRILASGIAFVYDDVDLDKVEVMAKSLVTYQFKPCFTNDASLPSATLGIYLSPINTNDPVHTQATAAYGQLVGMYPWVDDKYILFSFDPCPAGGAAQTGSGADCKTCVIMIPPP